MSRTDGTPVDEFTCTLHLTLYYCALLKQPIHSYFNKNPPTVNIYTGFSNYILINFENGNIAHPNNTYMYVLTNTNSYYPLRVLFELGSESESSCSLSVL